MANPRCYVLTNGQALTAGTVTNIVVSSTAAVRTEIYDMIFGFSSAPADNAVKVNVQRFTSPGTSTNTGAGVPRALDPADPASLSVGGINCTIEPTYTANQVVFDLGLNQRASHRWVADPRGPLKMPNTASNGLGVYGINASATPTFELTVFFNE